MLKPYILVVTTWSLETRVLCLSPSSATCGASVSSSGKRIVIVLPRWVGGVIQNQYMDSIQNRPPCNKHYNDCFVVILYQHFIQTQLRGLSYTFKKKLSKPYFQIRMFVILMGNSTFFCFLEQFRKHRDCLFPEGLKKYFDIIRTYCFFGENFFDNVPAFPMGLFYSDTIPLQSQDSTFSWEVCVFVKNFKLI